MNYKQLFTFALSVILILTTIGCDDSSSSPSTSGSSKSALFKSAGTFSFTSNRGNFAATGVFDTLMANASASGAFKYSEGNRSFVVIFAYNVVSQTNIQVAFCGIADTLNATLAGSYSFAGTNGSKIGIFGYLPNVADTSSTSAFYVLTNGSMNVTTLSTTSVIGTMSGNGYNVFDTTKTIAITNGSYNTPIVEHYYSLDDGGPTRMPKKIIGVIRKNLQLVD